MSELKPCPFCGSEAEIERKGTARQSMIIACTNCGGRMESGDVCGLTQPMAWAWNNRANSEILANLNVRWRNWKVGKTGRAVRHLIKAMQDDPSFAHSWQCNIAMPIYDNAKGKLDIHEANEIADKLMAHLFEVKPPATRVKNQWFP